MRRRYFRSFLYNILFYGLTAIACVLCLPALLLPRKAAMGVVYAFIYSNMFLERFVLGLRYEIRGAEHLPKEGSYIVAAKHQSAYETMKLHILFKDPAIILKKELLRIPLWGWYLAKSDVIAIDRSTPDAAIDSIQQGAKRMKEQGRPIIIFPQGTRVHVDATTDEKPYKIGVARVQEATKLPIIPLAMNSGMYWPRNGFWKSGGAVVFEFLKPIKRSKDRSTLLTKLENSIEPASLSLMNEAREKNARRKSFAGVAALCFAFILLAGYSALWFAVADRAQSEYLKTLANVSDQQKVFDTPTVSGYPGPITLRVPSEVVSTNAGVLQFSDLEVRGWPIPFIPIHVQTGDISFQSDDWNDALTFERLSADIIALGSIVEIVDSSLSKDDFEGKITGTVDLAQENIPKLDIVVSMRDHRVLIDALQTLGLIDERMGMFVGSGLNAFRDSETGIVNVPIYQKNDTIFVGPLAVYKLLPRDFSYRRRAKPVLTPPPVSPDASGQGSESLQGQVP